MHFWRLKIVYVSHSKKPTLSSMRQKDQSLYLFLHSLIQKNYICRETSMYLVFMLGTVISPRRSPCMQKLILTSTNYIVFLHADLYYIVSVLSSVSLFELDWLTDRNRMKSSRNQRTQPFRDLWKASTKMPPGIHTLL